MEKKFTDVGAFLDTVSDLPVLPSNIQKITDIMSDESKSAEDISAVIATDPGAHVKGLENRQFSFLRQGEPGGKNKRIGRGHRAS